MQVDKRFLIDNPMFFETDLSCPREVQMIHKYEDIGLSENDEYKMFVSDGSFVFTNKTDNKRITIHYPRIMDGVDYYEDRFKHVLSKYRLCIETAEELGFEI